MGPRIYPSYQDTNTTAKGSIIIDYQDIIPDNFGDYIQVTVNNEIRFLEYQHNNGLYATNVNIGDVVTISTVTPSIYYKFISVTRRDYTTDDNENDEGIVDIPIGITNDNTTTVSFTFTATTQNDSYNFEYRVVGTIGTSPSESCDMIGNAMNFSGMYVLAGGGFRTSGGLSPNYIYYSQTNGNFFTYYLIYNVWPIINGAAVSNEGLNLQFAIEGNGIYYSRNYGYNISASTISSGTLQGVNSEMDCSVSGQKSIFGSYSGSLFISNDYGANYTGYGTNKYWIKTIMPNDNAPYYGITDRDGDYIYQISSGGTISILSANAKAPTYSYYPGLTGTTHFTSFAISQDRKYVLATYQALGNVDNKDYSVLLSTDSGNTFSFIYTNREMDRAVCCMSADGKYQYFGTNTTNVGLSGEYNYSHDYGQTWAAAPVPINSACISISCSQDGKYVFRGRAVNNGVNVVDKSSDYGVTFSSGVLEGQYVKLNKA